MAKTIEGLYYSESHEWVKIEGEYGYVGITDYAQQAMGNIVYVDMPEEGDEFGAGEEINEALEDQPELINKDAYEAWIMKVKLNDPSEIESLMDAAAYAGFCEKEQH